MGEDDALEKAGRVEVFFAFGENFSGEMLLFIMLPSSLSWTLGPGWRVCVWGVGTQKARTNLLLRAQHCQSCCRSCPGLTSVSATGFHPFFLVTTNWVLALLEASLPPSFSPKPCKL